MIESTGIGGIIDALKHKASTLILIDRFIPTTKECSNCHNKYNIKLDERIYKCTNCGFIIDRDYNSALNMIYYGIIKLNELLKIKIIILPDRRGKGLLNSKPGLIYCCYISL